MTQEREMEQIGVRKAPARDGIFLNLRTGRLAETSDKEKPGFVPAETENNAGTKFNFFADYYDDICGYVKDMRWHEKKFDDGGVSRGWWIVLDVEGKDYILDLKSNDRPYHRTMATLVGMNFAYPIRFSAFTTKNKKNGKDQKWLLLYQGRVKPEGDENAGKPQCEQPYYAEKWLDLKLLAKLRASKGDLSVLTEDERGKISLTPDGVFDKDYPYVIQNEDGTWDFSRWTNFLIRKTKEETIPAIHAAQAIRDQTRAASSADEAGVPDFTGGPQEADAPEPPENMDAEPPPENAKTATAPTGAATPSATVAKPAAPDDFPF